LASDGIRSGDLFVALPGAKTHGARYAAAALAAGARAVLTDAAGEALLEPGTPRIVAEDVRAQLGALAAWFYGYPARRLALAGITGTNGKTSTAHLLEGALGGRFSKVALLGTIATLIDGQQIPSARTTLEAPDLQATFAAMVERGIEACVMEVSSHALAQHRVDGFRFDVVAFTNLSRDHLDFHGSMEEYFKTKASLFTPTHAGRGIINLEDDWGSRLAAQTDLPVETLSQDPAADWLVRPGRLIAGSTPFVVSGPDGLEIASEVALPGAYNVANAALALVTAVTMGVGGAAAARGIAQVRAVPGRMEVVTVPAPPAAPGSPVAPGPPVAPGSSPVPMVVVDYAHAPDAIAKVLAALRPHTAGRLIAVLGAGGDRDHGKRKLMGQAAAQGADLVFVTDDNPRDEDPGHIRAQLLSGAGAKASEIPDRVDAIVRAILEAGTTDTVVILGKGHERTIDYGGELKPHHDAAVARRSLALKMEANQ
jgi:UDP-N-acetylmuramoyl-L-alanyl-D-glutamate--2,6-diaminopimelate ligase